MYDNLALDRAWLELRRKILRYNEERGEKEVSREGSRARQRASSSLVRGERRGSGSKGAVSKSKIARPTASGLSHVDIPPEDEAAVANGRAAHKEDGDGSDDDGDEKIYNPLKLPLAWDGKPIPFWLYKLHGLGVEFPCEICGNYVYMGRRAFDKHFSEARHIYGLKCLGITNTSLFREITGIEEAERLWEKIQRDKAKVSSKGEGVVEMEDSEGNVMPQKVYDDLLKQGLL